MLRTLDRYIAAIRRGECDEILLHSGQPVRARSGDQTRVVVAQALRADQVQALIADIVPRDATKGFTADGDLSFHAQSGGQGLLVQLQRAKGILNATIRKSGDSVPPTRADIDEPSQSARVYRQAVEPFALPRPREQKEISRPTARPAPPEKEWAPEIEIERIPASGVQHVKITPTSGGRRQLEALLTTLVQQGASDLHLTANMQPRMRKDGEIRLLPGAEGVLSSENIRAMLMDVASPLAREKFERTTDADYSYEVPGLARFRINAFKDRRGFSGCIRVIPMKIYTFDELGLPPVVREFCSLKKGLVLVTGPAGSGKSTTLAAMIDLINKTRRDHVITIEDPIEFVHEPIGCLVNQRELHVDTQTYATALRAALREDPDIILVGELRDLETVATAIETAETGHLVLGTLHTTTGPTTIDRVIDQFPADRQAQIRAMLAESLRGVIAQTLCKKILGGRVLAHEILVCNIAVAHLIREGKTFQIPSMMQTHKALGMQLLNESLFNLVKTGVVAPEEAYLRAVDRPTFKMMLEKAQIRLERVAGVN